MIGANRLLPALQAERAARGAAHTAGDVRAAANGGAGQAAGGATDTADDVGRALQGLAEETRDVHLVYCGAGDSFILGGCRSGRLQDCVLSVMLVPRTRDAD